MKDILKDLKNLQIKNDWIGIINKYNPEEIINNKTELWENANVLSAISFATAKLSEAYINLKYAFRNDSEKLEFLNKQKSYRNLTIALRKRAIELDPKNQTYYSNLAYSHYQFLRELTLLGGRRDGNPIKEAEEAISYINKSLSINPNRINDLYRKGQIQTEILPKILIFSKKSRENKEHQKEASLKAKQLIEEGITAFEKAIVCWETIPNTEEWSKKRQEKGYIKSLYDLARARFDLIQNNWEAIQFVLSLDYGISDDDRVTFIPEDLSNINLAIDSIRKCIYADNRSYLIDNSRSSLENDIAAAKSTGVYEGVFKLYSYGKFLFTRYWILSGYGQRSNDEANKNRNDAEQVLLESLKFDWSIEKQRQDKLFITEKIARLYITKKEYEKALQIIVEHLSKTKKRPDYYISYTLATAYIGLGKYSEAQNVLEQGLENRGNKEIWLGYFLKACNELRHGSLEKCKSFLNESIDIAKRSGKVNIDSLLIAQGFVSYKENNKEEALNFLKRAKELNPYRAFVNKRVENWGKAL